MCFVVNNFINRKWLTANVAGYLVLAIDFLNHLGQLLHQAVRADRALVVVPLTTELAEKLSTVKVGALYRIVNYLLADPAQKVFVEFVEGRTAEPKHVEALQKLSLILVFIQIFMLTHRLLIVLN